MPAKKTSKWITHVKAYSKANNCSYGDAMSRAKSSYKGSGGGRLADAQKWVKNHKAISSSVNWIADNGYAGKHGNLVRKIGSIAGRFGYGK